MILKVFEPMIVTITKHSFKKTDCDLYRAKITNKHKHEEEQEENFDEQKNE